MAKLRVTVPSGQAEAFAEPCERHRLSVLPSDGVGLLAAVYHLPLVDALPARIPSLQGTSQQYHPEDPGSIPGPVVTGVTSDRIAAAHDVKPDQG